jgi:NAD(P)-dependent dehydrogenase (short-subunit alcohol dehydrogenase family)
MDLHLSGKLAIVTGASKGIGLAVTRALVEEGAMVVATRRGRSAAWFKPVAASVMLASSRSSGLQPRVSARVRSPRQAQLRSSRRGRDGCLDPPELSQLVRGEGDEQDKSGQDANHNGSGCHEADFVQSQRDTSTPDDAVHRQDR